MNFSWKKTCNFGRKDWTIALTDFICEMLRKPLRTERPVSLSSLCVFFFFSLSFQTSLMKPRVHKCSLDETEPCRFQQVHLFVFSLSADDETGVLTNAYERYERERGTDRSSTMTCRSIFSTQVNVLPTKSTGNGNSFGKSLRRDIVESTALDEFLSCSSISPDPFAIETDSVSKFKSGEEQSLFATVANGLTWTWQHVWSYWKKKFLSPEAGQETKKNEKKEKKRWPCYMYWHARKQQTARGRTSVVRL